MLAESSGTGGHQPYRVHEVARQNGIGIAEHLEGSDVAQVQGVVVGNGTGIKHDPPPGHHDVPERIGSERSLADEGVPVPPGPERVL